MNNVKKMNLAKYLARDDPYFGNLSKRDSSNKFNNSSKPINIDSKRNSSTNETKGENDMQPAKKPTDFPNVPKKGNGGLLKRNNNTRLDPITIEDNSNPKKIKID